MDRRLLTLWPIQKAILKALGLALPARLRDSAAYTLLCFFCPFSCKSRVSPGSCCPNGRSESA